MKIVGSALRVRRTMTLTPMIDVVFLLLIFFMMISRFGGTQGVEIGSSPTGPSDWRGPPRLVDVGAGGVALNGRPLAETALAEALMRLMLAPGDPVVLRMPEAAPGGPASVQRVIAVVEALQDAGLPNIVLLEGPDAP